MPEEDGDGQAAVAGLGTPAGEPGAEPEPVCGMNHAFIAGYLEGLKVSGVQAILAPRPGECCVQLGPTKG